MKRYSVLEIDQMRDSVGEIMHWESILTGRNVINSDYHTTVEARLRTYMANGTEQDELAERVTVLRRQFDARAKA